MIAERNDAPPDRPKAGVSVGDEQGALVDLLADRAIPSIPSA